MTTLLIPIRFSHNSPTSRRLAEPRGMRFIASEPPVEIKLDYLGPLAIDQLGATFADRPIRSHAIRTKSSSAKPLRTPL